MPVETAMPQFEFADGVLHIRSVASAMRIRWNPEPRAEIRDGRGAWRDFRPDFRLVRPPASEARAALPLEAEGESAGPDVLDRKRIAFDAFRGEIPPEFVSRVERFGSHQWSLLVLIRAERAALDLAASNPVLAYCLANNDEFRGTEADAAAVQAVWYSHRRQRVILQFLRFPESEAVVRLLRKIRPEAVFPSLMRRLAGSIRVDRRVLEILGHHSSINRGMLELVANPRIFPYVTPRLLYAVADSPAELAEAPTADQILSAVGTLQEAGLNLPVRPLTTIRQVEEFRERVDAEIAEAARRREEAARRAREAQAERERRARAAREAHAQALRRIRERERAARAAGRRLRRPAGPDGERGAVPGLGALPVPTGAVEPFPPPPVPGTPDIVPLRSAADLEEEGREQRNCVASYAWRVRRGMCYIYRVLQPERATLSIVPGPDGGWRRFELKRKENRGVRESTKHFVDRWLERFRFSV